MRTPSATERDPPATLESFESFFRSRFALVARTAALAVRDFELGQDLAQEAFARTYQRWDGMSSTEHAMAFVFKVALNLARSHHRKEARRRMLRLPPTPSPVDEPGAASDRLTLAAAPRDLSARQRSCLALVDYAGVDAASAGRILGMRASTVRVHLTRGRRLLSQSLERTYGKDPTDD